MTSVCFEAIASVWLFTKKKMIPHEADEQIFAAHDHLEQTKTNMEARQKELEETMRQLAKEAVAAQKAGQKHVAKRKLTERVQANSRLQRLHSAMAIVDQQLDTIKANELDKEIMLSLKASSMALKKAGIGINAAEVENVIAELDDHMREAQVSVYYLVFFW